VVVRVDHPCILVVLHNPTGVPLFVVGLGNSAVGEKP
jgi:hypothetical protein